MRLVRLVMRPMAARVFGPVRVGPSFRCLNGERRRMDPEVVLELEKEPIGSGRRDLNAEGNSFG
jgi:hypothetical protein